MYSPEWMRRCPWPERREVSMSARWLSCLWWTAATWVLTTGVPPVGAEPVDHRQQIVQDDRTVAVSSDGRPVLRYLFAPAQFKPYVDELYSPAGAQVLRDAPADHKHHHGLMFAVNVEGVEFWGREDEKCGKQISRGVEGVKAASVDGRGESRFTQRLDWVAPDGRVLVRECRTVCVHSRRDLGATVVSWHSRLEPADGRDSVELSGRNYLGLGVRFVQSMDANGTLVVPGGVAPETDKAGHELYDVPWIAYVASADDKPVTVALFDSPSNPRYPARMFTMNRPFAYLSATLGLEKVRLPLLAGKPLDLRYGVAVLDGPAEAHRIESLYKQWTALPQ